MAGVGNIILRNDIDGIELFASGNVSEQGGPADYTLSAAYGKQFDRGFVGIGGEYARRGGFRLGDRDFLAGCDTDYEITQGGEIRTLNVAENANVLNDSGGTVTTPNGSCKLDRIIGRISIAGTRVGSVYYDDRTYPTTNVPGNTGIPFFSETTDAFGQPVDRDGDGVRDIDLFQRTANGFQQNVNFISPEDRYNVLAYGEYRITDDDYGITPFFEALYSRADVNVDQSSIGQFFQYVPGYNQTNPCNLTTGLDCRNADNVFNGLIPGRPSSVPGFPSERLSRFSRSYRFAVTGTTWKPASSSIVAFWVSAAICRSSTIRGVSNLRVRTRVRKVRASVAASVRTRPRWLSASIRRLILTVTALSTMTAMALRTISSLRLRNRGWQVVRVTSPAWPIRVLPPLTLASAVFR